jgi:hypothetical protein
LTWLVDVNMAMIVGALDGVPEKCMAAQETDWMTFTISLGLAIGIVISYLPQVLPGPCYRI